MKGPVKAFKNFFRQRNKSYSFFLSPI